MTIRPIRSEELEVYCALDNSGLADAVRTLWLDGRSSPDLCFVAEDGRRPVGRAFFHKGPSPASFGMFGMHIDPSVDFRETGMKLLTEALARLAESGAACVSDDIYDIYEQKPVEKQDLLEAVGFRQFQEKRRYVWSDPGVAVEVPARLEFRPLSVVGEDAFTAAVGRVTEGTLDRDDRADVEKYGLDQAGWRYVAVLKEIELLPQQWQLGFLPDGRLCGLVVPQRLPFEDEGAINYIGVVPELRGSGYGFDLLMEGTAILQRRGLKKVIAETDVENRPFHAELERAGYKHKGTLRLFRCELTHPAGG